VRAAVNLEFADWDTEVGLNDEVAFIPPVSGGC
jgi:molybdopterin converting factor small subunit